MKKYTTYILTILLLYLTLADFLLIHFGCILYSGRNEADVFMLMSMIGAMTWWIMLQFHRWRLRLWYKLGTYIGIITVIAGTFPINLFVLRMNEYHQIYAIYLVVGTVSGKIAVWIFWLWFISNSNMRKFGFN